MKINFLLLAFTLFFLMSEIAFSSEITAKIISIDRSYLSTKKDLVFLSSGQVVKLNQENKFLRDYVFSAQIRKNWIKFEINDQREIENVSLSEPPYDVVNSYEVDNINSKNLQSDAPYSPSILKSLSQAQELFDQAPYKKKESQCYNKAHIWAYEWRTKNKLYSSKIWIFFTRKYIREFEFEWWFHVAPYVHVVVGDKVKERVMDKKYTKGPLKINDWANIFMRNSAKCPVVDKYTDHADYPESAYCFFMKSSMYYYQPIDLEKLEQEKITRNRWFYPEVKHAYQEAFDIEI
jgi:hypothetical protein